MTAMKLEAQLSQLTVLMERQMVKIDIVTGLCRITVDIILTSRTKAPIAIAIDEIKIKK